ncbi:biotin--[acetyl-CoA-carboxylase] ligase [Salipaludibacillus keqinensis]|uniref:Bifunctional ligase/repressor BirA n=1 Tax=Salipaludibacillus keqinensis TaxID=2045207 RepID=A0A323TJ24_9BACI|nr:biotin--[acetyl-CoA-carboxylase] ligase [Salipaludibacillus keqinensis]PYZ94540.1 biotin--[acetyl-CoA-carboxylase] ligase [Salipaludibacillus keqinensis]
MKTKVLTLLRENKDTFLSGEKISNELDCSRTAVWKHIDSLRKEGYDIVAVQNKGYQLKKSGSQLSEHDLVSRIKENNLFHHVVYHSLVTSTQVIAHQLVNEGAREGTIVVADEQTAGKGRLGRTWDSQHETGIWMSLILKPLVDFRQAPQLTLVAAVALARALQNKSGQQIDIKWPNDLLVNGKKICGILTELQADPDRIKSVIIGIGVNVNHEHFPQEITDIATSLKKESGKNFDRAELITDILDEFSWLYEAYLTNGFSLIKPLWEAHSLSIGKKVIARRAKDSLVGIALGINENGVLLLQDETGHVHEIYSADIEIS